MIATAEETPEIMDNFRMPHGTNAKVIAARARAFADAAGPLKPAAPAPVAKTAPQATPQPAPVRTSERATA